MLRHFRVLVLFVPLLFNSQATPAQTEITRAAPRGNAVVGSEATNDPGKTRVQEVSRQASEEAKRLHKMGVKYGLSGLFRQAAELFEKAVELNPNFADAHYSLGHAYFDLGRYEDAIQSLEKAILLNPKDKEARLRLEEAQLLASENAKRSPQTGKEMSPSLSPNASRSSTPLNETAAGSAVSLNDASGSDRKAAAARSTEIDLTRVYHVGAGDVLEVRLGDNGASQATLFTVTPSGLLEHPILSEPLPVAGLTVEEIQSRLEADLKRRAVNENPKVMIGVREYLSHAIIVSGLVKDPGTKLLRREGIPLYVVIADAQPSPDAGRATLIRHETGEAVVVDLSKPTEMNLIVRSGDVITVDSNPKQFFYVGGEVKAPGEKLFRPGITLTQAILAAGGLSRESKEVQIARESENGFLISTRYKLKDINTGKRADPMIQPGDRITVEQ
jgi:protein involved in polysaccharide export with SLBB domain